MKMNDKAYLCIDLKSFYASVECVERGLDPMTTNLVVADSARTEKTICLAVSPSLKAYGLPGRARLFEVIQKITEINSQRRRLAPGKRLTGKSFDDAELKAAPQLELDFITAVPRMGHYLKFSTDIYNIYLIFGVSAKDMRQSLRLSDFILWAILQNALPVSRTSTITKNFYIKCSE